MKQRTHMENCAGDTSAKDSRTGHVRNEGGYGLTAPEFRDEHTEHAAQNDDITGRAGDHRTAQRRLCDSTAELALGTWRRVQQRMRSWNTWYCHSSAPRSQVDACSTSPHAANSRWFTPKGRRLKGR